MFYSYKSKYVINYHLHLKIGDALYFTNISWCNRDFWIKHTFLFPQSCQWQYGDNFMETYWNLKLIYRKNWLWLFQLLNYLMLSCCNQILIAVGRKTTFSLPWCHPQKHSQGASDNIPLARATQQRQRPSPSKRKIIQCGNYSDERQSLWEWMTPKENSIAFDWIRFEYVRQFTFVELIISYSELGNGI